MTDEQLKSLAELVLVNNARITALSEFVNKWAEISLPLFPAESPVSKRALALLSSFEQQEASAKQSEAAMGDARKFFGLKS